MLRTIEIAEGRPWLLFAAVFAATLFFGFVTQAAGSLYLSWIGDPIVTQFRTTLSYTSALVGDAILLPVVNVFMTSQLWEWRRVPRTSEVVAALSSAALLTVAVHLYQAANAMLNWTMMEPYSWTALGYVHAAFMFAELSFVLFFWGQVALVTRERPRAIFSQRVVYAFLCSLVFIRLLLGDYGYFSVAELAFLV
ncbi:MAG: hypothetical protein ACRDGT_09120 [Candidatus Limnocylindria bacterium]